MARQRFRRSGKDSFFGHFVYDRVVPQNHFLRKLNEMMDWEEISQNLALYYKGGASQGPTPYEPTMLLSHRDPVRKDALGLLSL